MTPGDLTPDHARRALRQMVDPADDDDLVTAYARASWSTLVEPGDRVAGELIAAHGPVRALELAQSPDAPDLAGAAVSADDVAAARERWRPRMRVVDDLLSLARRSHVTLVTPEHADWPTRLDDLGPFAPLCLWVRGDPRLLGGAAPAVALVGARAHSAYGDHVARELAAESAVAGIAVYSGAAYGIDGAAHAAALAAGGVTVAVMAGGLERTYPTGHVDLVERIANSGAVIAEVPCGTAPTKHRFLARNRLIAALSDGTVVVEAGWRSGALNTAHHAQAIGRPVGVVPGPVTSASSRGCHRLLRESDAVCVTGIEDVRELIGAERTTLAAEPLSEGRTDDRTRVLDALSARSPRPAEDIARRAGMSVGDATTLLGLLELDGTAERRVTGWVQTGARPAATLW